MIDREADNSDSLEVNFRFLNFHTYFYAFSILKQRDKRKSEK